MILNGYKDGSMIHSEADAFRKAKGILDKTKTFECVNVRFTKGNKLKLSKPCSCCYRFMKTMGCSKVYFSTEIGFAEIRL